MGKSNWYEQGEALFEQEEYEEALECYMNGLEEDDADCINAAAYCFSEGIGTDQDLDYALWCYEKAVALGSLKALSSLGVFLIRTNPDSAEICEKALGYVTEAAEKGYLDGYTNLGYCYGSGCAVLEKDPVKAFECYLKAAEMGSSLAQNTVAARYYQGDGVEQNLQKAAEWYQKAAENNYADAAWTLMQMYEYGYGVSADKEERAKWLRKAAELGSLDAQAALGYELAQEDNYEEAVVWYEKAARRGDSASMANLGYCYLYGNGVEKDKQQARYWLYYSGLPVTMVPDELLEDDEYES